MTCVRPIGLLWLGAFRFVVSAEPVPPVESLRVTAPVKTLTATGQPVQLTALATQQGGDAIDVTPESKWTTYRSSRPTVVEVSPDGLCTAVGPGTAVIVVINAKCHEDIAALQAAGYYTDIPGRSERHLHEGYGLWTSGRDTGW